MQSYRLDVELEPGYEEPEYKAASTSRQATGNSKSRNHVDRCGSATRHLPAIKHLPCTDTIMLPALVSISSSQHISSQLNHDVLLQHASRFELHHGRMKFYSGAPSSRCNAVIYQAPSLVCTSCLMTKALCGCVNYA